MASFADAITGSIVAGMDPMNGVIRQLAQSQASSARVELDKERIKVMTLLQKLIDDGKANGSDSAVIESYRRMLEHYTE